ncbi:MAG TPA: hypothetical protein VLC09_02120, partial [Polyangiaceae bacterium]|nr:hypothetical protein [Polyangiaceae bacterium]
MRVADGPESRGPAGETPQRLDPLPGPRPEPTGGDWNAQEAVRAAAHGELSTELLQQSVDRLFAIAVTTAGLACLLCIGVTLAPHAPWTDMWRGQFAALAALGALYAALTRYRRLRPAGVLDLGYVHLFATCLLLGFIRYSGPLPTQGAWLLLAPSSLPILAFATLIPAKPRIALSTSIAAALLDPLCASLLGVHRVVPLAYLALWGASPLVAAGIGFGMSRALHRLSASIAAAIEVGSYRLVDRLGTGGMAEVWRADHRMLARPAAVKLIRTEILEGHGPEASARLIRIFLREARVTATLESPHTIQLYDFGITREGALYYVMELLDGLDLKSLVERFGPLPPERAVYLLRQMCRSLGEAHERGLI